MRTYIQRSNNNSGGASHHFWSLFTGHGHLAAECWHAGDQPIRASRPIERGSRSAPCTSASHARSAVQRNGRVHWGGCPPVSESTLAYRRSPTKQLQLNSPKCWPGRSVKGRTLRCRSQARRTSLCVSCLARIARKNGSRLFCNKKNISAHPHAP